jgi:hypothetical protein
MIIKNKAGREFYVRIVMKGDKYGLDDCLTHDESDPLIEFYDFSHATALGGLGKFECPPPGPRGQFVSRYNASILAARKPEIGLDLDGGVPEWKIDASAMEPVMVTAQALVRTFGPGAEGDLRAAFANLVRLSS